MSNRRIHILGASGTGTTTLGSALAQELGILFFDTDTYFWLPGEPPFTHKRPIPERIEMLNRDLAVESWVLSGSLCGWGDVLIPRFTHVVFLLLDNDIRLARIKTRERERYGSRIDEHGDRRKAHEEFMAWCDRYETGGMNVRSRVLHEDWLTRISCPVLRLQSENSVNVMVSTIVQELTTG